MFVLIAALAIFSHFRAMTTDPGAVPPNAGPLPTPEELVEEGGEDLGVVKAGGGVDGEGDGLLFNNVHGDVENNNKNSNNNNNNRMITQRKTPASSAPNSRTVRKLCRRCNSFKPQRAHHCSICRRCIIKMVSEKWRFVFEFFAKKLMFF